MFAYQSVPTKSIAGERILRGDAPEDEWADTYSELSDSVQDCAKEYLEKTRRLYSLQKSDPCPLYPVIIIRHRVNKTSDEHSDRRFLSDGKPVAFLPAGNYSSLEEVMKALVKWAFMVSNS